MKTILITGGAGYVGAVLVPALLKKGYQVKILDVFLYGDGVFDEVVNRKNLTLVKGDIRDSTIVRNSLKGVESVIHLACISNDPSFELDPLLGKSINYDATIQLINFAKKMGIKRFIYASSSSVYGVKKEREVTENLVCEPLTDYSKYKVLCENYLLSQQSKGFTVVIMRPATVCGYSPRMRLDLTVNILTIQALVNKKIIVYGGLQYRPNIHIKDMADVYELLLDQSNEKIAGKIYNIGYENYTISELAGMVKETLGDHSITIETRETADLRSYRISSTKIARELGFSPRKSIEDAIGDIRHAYLEGKLPDPMNTIRYYNIRTMKQRMKEVNV